MLKQYSFDVSILVLLDKAHTIRGNQFTIDCKMNVNSESMEFSINTLCNYIERHLQDIPGVAHILDRATLKPRPDVVCCAAPRAVLFNPRLEPIDGYVEKCDAFDAQVARLIKLVNPTKGSCV